MERSAARETTRSGAQNDRSLSPNGGRLMEYAVAQLSRTASRLPEVSATEASGLPIAGATAVKVLKSGGNKFAGSNGKVTNALITVNSGGVGSYAIQVTKLTGIHVRATCGARNMDVVKSLGADEVLDYMTPGGAGLKSPYGKKYDVVVHCTVGIS